MTYPKDREQSSLNRSVFTDNFKPEYCRVKVNSGVQALASRGLSKMENESKAELLMTTLLTRDGSKTINIMDWELSL